MKPIVHFKAVLDNSWITVDTTSLYQNKLHVYYCMIVLICRIAKMSSTSCVIIHLAHYVADVIPLLVYLIIYSLQIQCFDKAKKCISNTIKKNNICTIFCVLMFQQFLAYKHHRLRDSMSPHETRTPTAARLKNKPKANHEPHPPTAARLTTNSQNRS